MKWFFVFVFLFFGLAVSLYAKSERMFVIERSKNANIVCYDANINEDGTINKENPVDAYWLLYAKKNGEREELSSFDKKAYGFKVQYNETDKQFDFVLKAVKDKPMTINIYDNIAKTVIKINDIDCFLEKVYIESKDGAFGIPTVNFYELYGSEVSTGKPQKQKITAKAQKQK